jgi:PDZ domain-containing protein
LNKKRSAWLRVGVALVIVGSLQGYLARNYLIIGPGPVQKMEEMVTVETGKKDAEGAFLLTAVTSAPAGIPSWITALVSPDVDITRRGQEIPKGMDIDRYISIMESLMRESQVVAGAVALERLGFPVKVETVVRIEAVLANSPAKGILKQNDIILAVDDRRVATADEAVKIIGQRAPGAEVLLIVARQGKVKTFQVGTGPHPEDRARAAVGILVSSSLTYDLPLDIKIDSRNVKGSSAGLMFTLEILNQLDPADLTGGEVIAGTGTIGLDGTVGPIAGIKQKLAAAERGGAAYFLVPMENFEAAEKIAKGRNALKVIGVSDIDNAIMVLDDISRRNNGTSGEY